MIASPSTTMGRDEPGSWGVLWLNDWNKSLNDDK
jgi:hypothetical protein